MRASEKLTEKINVMMTKAERNAVEKAAAKDERTVSSWARKTLAEKALKTRPAK